MSYTMVYYFIPEDFDSPEELNAFGISKPIDQITLADIRSSFPIPGKYHFRFKHAINKVQVWMDLNGDDCKALVFQNKIILKVTRIQWETVSVSKQLSPRLPKGSQNNTFNVFDFNPQAKTESKVSNFDLLFQN